MFSFEGHLNTPSAESLEELSKEITRKESEYEKFEYQKQKDSDCAYLLNMFNKVLFKSFFTSGHVHTEYINGLYEFKHLKYCSGSKYDPVGQMIKVGVKVNLNYDNSRNKFFSYNGHFNRFITYDKKAKSIHCQF